MEVTKQAERYRAFPVEIEAIQVSKDNIDEVGDFFGHTKGDKSFGWHTKPSPHWAIIIGGGIFHAYVEDWVVKKANGAYYPLSSEAFSLTYELVED